MIINNPIRRCVSCGGREILTVENDTVIDSSLTEDNHCKNIGECSQNKKSYNTQVMFGIDDNGDIVSETFIEDGVEIINIKKGEDVGI